ncbi:alpha/beta hydrolase [uncultured Vagococcus sp.]|uniref:alpha/beta hydrolase n=1 Tax=uncultured Vagococcus sp. TaxID=189676 RepID=UPI0028D1B8CD|nr:alpha/beta hydrolase [uncultured Vagococcus sp.]
MKVTRGMIHPDLRLKGTVIRKIFNFKSEKTFRTTAKLVRKVMQGKTSELIDCQERLMTKKEGGSLRLCLYQSHNPQPKATGILWFHGGGYATGVPEMDMAYYEKLIATSNCVIVSPDYTLSTEAPYPAALEDGYEALLWLKDHAEELGIRSDQLFVGGDSAGGGLTIATLLYARDQGEVNVAFQLPMYPMIDDRMNTPSMIDNDAPVWNERSNRIAWDMYLGELKGTSEVPIYAAPSRETNYHGLPPAYTFIGTVEPFYDETVSYIKALQGAGIEAEIDVYEGCFHGFDIVGRKKPVSQTALNKMLAAFKRATDHYYAKQDE